MQTTYAPDRSDAVAHVGVDARAAFLARTYVHLFGAIAVFTALEIVLFRNGWMELLAAKLSGNWMLALGGFMVVGWLASRTAHRARGLPLQYLALGGFVVAEALIFAPLLYVAASFAPGVIHSAAIVTMAGFTALTCIVFFTRKDFSFMRGLLMWGGVAALLAIFGGLLFGWQLGMWFSVAMIAFAGASILYDTSNVLHHYSEDRYVGASLELFSSVALLFWYVLTLFLNNRD